jgi:glycosyltransferase involved in cell wall biosynthesis
MKKQFQYQLISTNDKELELKTYIKSNSKKERKPKTKLKNKILKKHLSFTIFKFFVFFVVIYFSLFILLELIITINSDYFNNINTIILNLINLANIVSINADIKSTDEFNEINNQFDDTVNPKDTDIKNNETIIEKEISTKKDNITNTDLEQDIKKDKDETDIKRDNDTNKMKEVNDTEKNNNLTYEKDINEDKKNDTKKKEINFDFIYDDRNTSFKKAYNFLIKCLEHKLIHNITKNISVENPEVTAVIPVYNSKNYINRCIKSIQNQNMSNIEIILVNDFSTDDTLNYTLSLQEEDPRIKIINNKKNMGILYSRSVGALSAKGKYIFPIDNDDMFLGEELFSSIAYIADKGNFDIVEFKGMQTRQKGNKVINEVGDTNWGNHKLNLVMFQPELGDYPLRASRKIGDYDKYDVYLWNKCIRTKIYQKALNKMGEDRYSRFMLAHEDVVAVFFLFNTAQSFKFVGKYGIFHIQGDGTAFGKTKPIVHDLKHIYLLDVVLEFSQNTNEHRKLIPNLLIKVLKLKYLNEIVKSQYNNKLIKSILDKVLKSDNYSGFYKNEIIKRGKLLKFLNYTF